MMLSQRMNWNKDTINLLLNLFINQIVFILSSQQNLIFVSTIYQTAMHNEFRTQLIIPQIHCDKLKPIIIEINFFSCSQCNHFNI
ncbi:hypothetical protein pb186bvf_009215 [Paramecium bursaria]